MNTIRNPSSRPIIFARTTLGIALALALGCDELDESGPAKARPMSASTMASVQAPQPRALVPARDNCDVEVLGERKVVRAALQNAASISGLLLTTDTMVTELKEEDGSQVDGSVV